MNRCAVLTRLKAEISSTDHSSCSDTELERIADERIVYWSERAKEWQPPSLAAYGYFVSEGGQTIGDVYAEMQYRRDSWTLARHCPPDRPPLWPELAKLARPDLGEVYIGTFEREACLADWAEYKYIAPTGPIRSRLLEGLFDRLAVLQALTPPVQRWGYGLVRTIPAKGELHRPALIAWHALATPAEFQIASSTSGLHSPVLPWGTLAGRLVWAREEAGLKAAQVPAATSGAIEMDELSALEWGSKPVVPADRLACALGLLADLYEVSERWLRDGVTNPLPDEAIGLLLRPLQPREPAEETSAFLALLGFFLTVRTRGLS